MSKKIVFVNQATGYLTIDVINEFAQDFDELALITGSIREQDHSLHPKVTVSKIVRYNRGDAFRKAVSWFIGTMQILFLLKFKYRDYERFFYTIPPTAYLLASSTKQSYSIAVMDLFPEALKVFGFSEKNFLYRWWGKRNKRIFSRSHRIFTLSEKMKSKILEFSKDSEVRKISNWSAFSEYMPVNKEDNKIRKREGLGGKFVIQYSGNIGVTHRLEILVELADMLKDHEDIEFLIVGRGDRSKAIGDLIDSKGLENCRLLPYREDGELYESLCVADIGVVTLDDQTPDVSVPSKVYNILAAGVPVMAIAHLDSSVSEIVLKHEAGKSFNSKDFAGMTDFILDLKNNPAVWKAMSEKSRGASACYTRTNATKYLEFYKK